MTGIANAYPRLQAVVIPILLGIGAIATLWSAWLLHEAGKQAADALEEQSDGKIERLQAIHNSWSVRSWHLVTWLLLAVALVASPAAYVSVFPNVPMAEESDAPSPQIRIDAAKGNISAPEDNDSTKLTLDSVLITLNAHRPSSSAQKPYGCESAACREHYTALAAAIPLNEKLCPACRADRRPSEALSNWFSKYRYPIWAGESSCWQVEVAFLAFVAFFCACNGLLSTAREARARVRLKCWGFAALSFFASAVAVAVGLHVLRLGLFALYFSFPSICMELLP
jgi:hypothetical protein